LSVCVPRTIVSVSLKVYSLSSPVSGVRPSYVIAAAPVTPVKRAWGMMPSGLIDGTSWPSVKPVCALVIPARSASLSGGPFSVLCRIETDASIHHRVADDAGVIEQAAVSVNR
jgi:hypothetical protein